MIDYEHLMDYDQYRRFENMIEFDMKEKEERFESYVDPDNDYDYKNDIPF
jgi:hypothetical protein